MLGLTLVAFVISIPAQLTPHVQSGQQLVYSTNVRVTGTFGHRMRALSRVRILSAHESPTRWSVEASMQGKNPSAPDVYSFDGAGKIHNASGSDGRAGGFFFYNAALYGLPPTNLVVGSEWTFATATFSDFGPPGRGMLKVISIKDDEVDLSLDFHGTGVKDLPSLPRMPAGQMHETSAVTGTLTFVRGILQQEQLQSRDMQQFGNDPPEQYFSKITMALTKS